MESKPKIIRNFFFNYFPFLSVEKNFRDTIDIDVDVAVIVITVVVVAVVVVALVLPEIKDKSRSKILFFSYE